MPRYHAGHVELEADEEALVRGMNCARPAWNDLAFRPSNIAALHFDGLELARMIAVHRESVRIDQPKANRY